MFNIHLYTGLALCILVTILGLTGSLIVYKPETERLMSARIATVDPLRETVSVEELYAQVRAFRSADRIGSLHGVAITGIDNIPGFAIPDVIDHVAVGHGSARIIA